MNPVLSFQLRWTQMMFEAQAVATMRVLGMAGFWATAPSETLRMVSEKHETSMKSANRGMAAVIAGKSPADVSNAMLRPVARKVTSNHKRLTKRGPSLPNQTK